MFKGTIGKNFGHRKISKNKKDRNLCVYTVYDNKTDTPVIVDGSPRKCAEAMGMKLSSFYSAITRCNNGENKRWTILGDYVDDIAEEMCAYN